MKHSEAIEEELIHLITGKVASYQNDVSWEELYSLVRKIVKKNIKTDSIDIIREEIVKVGKHLYLKDFLPGTSGNISVRINEDSFLITPSGFNKGSMKYEDVLLVDMEGNKLEAYTAGKPSSEIKMHILAYKKRKDVGAVVHTHPPFCTAFASSRTPLNIPVLPEAIIILGDVQLVEYSTPSTSEVPDRLEPYLEGNNTFLLSNHGAMTLGRNLEEASHRMETLEFFARVILLTRLLGGERMLNAEDVSKLKRTFGMTV